MSQSHSEPQAMEQAVNRAMSLAQSASTRNLAERLDRFSVLAEHGWVDARLALAFMHDDSAGQTSGAALATTQLLLAAAQGDSGAFLALAARYRSGRGAPKDHVLARMWAELALMREFPGAAATAMELNQHLSEDHVQRARTLASAYRKHLGALGTVIKNLESASNNAETSTLGDVITKHHDSFELSELSTDPARRGASDETPPIRGRTRWVSEQPRVLSFTDFIREDIRSLLLRGSVMAAPVTDLESPCTARRWPLIQDPLAALVAAEIATTLSYAAENADVPWLLQFAAEENFGAHVDYLDAPNLTLSTHNSVRRGQQIATGMLCLVSAEAGGELHYPQIDQRIMQQAGDLAIHFNVRPDGTSDPATAHETTSVRVGERWSLRMGLWEYADSYRSDVVL